MKRAMMSKHLRGIPAAGLLLVFAFAFVLGPALQPAASAQDAAGDWTAPVNISSAGSSSNPEIIVDGEGISHAIWFDEIAGYRYAQTNAEGGWEQPKTVIFPFGEFHPRLINGALDTVSAFWRNEQSALYVSSASAESFGDNWKWDKQKLLAESAPAFDVAVDSEGILHLVYLNSVDTAQNPSGLYYRRSLGTASNWSLPRLIYPSLYLRSLSPEKLNVSVTVVNAGEQETVIAAWDDSPSSKIFFSRSTDAGANWEAPIEVDGTGETAGSAVPFGVDVTTWNDQVLMVWKRGNPESNCTILYQGSTDQGQTWDASGTIADNLSGCAANSNFLTGLPDVLLYQAAINRQIYLTAWDGTRWSQPQVQSKLTSIEDPVTKRPLLLGSLKMALTTDQKGLVAIGSDEDGNNDIWATFRPLGDMQTWFPPASAWKKPVEIFRTGVEVNSLHLLADSSGGLHSLWMQPFVTAGESSQPPSSTDRYAIYYSGWDGTAWSEPVAIMQSVQGRAGHMSAVMSPDGKLLITWQGDQTGEIYFSWANAARAYISAEWAAPVSIPVLVNMSRFPEIAVWQDVIYVLYSVPINEMRGVYLTRSVDGGQKWSQPFQVFDAQSASWEMVGDPSLAVSPDGQLHALWVRESLPGTRGSLGLYYARSDDDGESWSEVETVSEAGVLWGKVIAAANGSLYKVWQENGGPNIIHSRISVDQGKTWSSPESFAGMGEIDGPPALFSDPAGKVYFLQFTTDQSANPKLQNWENLNSGWTSSENQNPTQGIDTTNNALAGTVTRNGDFAVIYAASPVDENSAKPENIFYFTSRSVELPSVLPTPPPPSTRPIGSGETEATPLPTATATPTAAPALPTEFLKDANTPPSSAGGSLTGLFISIALAGIFVGIGFAVLLSRNRFR
jgi:hypothetical protein